MGGEYVMKVSVTNEHIEQGIRKSPGYCPVAIAIKHASSEWVEVSSLHVRYPGMKGRNLVPLPDAAVAFIKLFDKGLPASPFTFDLQE